MDTKRKCSDCLLTQQWLHSIWLEVSETQRKTDNYLHITRSTHAGYLFGSVKNE